MQKKQTLGYDDTKKMLNTLRKLNESRTSFGTIREQLEVPQEQVPQKDDITVINDVDVKMVSTDQADMQLTEEQKESISNLIDSFRQQVTQSVDFEPGLSIEQDKVRLDGKLTDEEISFVFIAGGEEHGVYINAEMLKLDVEVGNALEKLVKFDQTFKTSMDNIITQRKHN
jgi:hypothetical protein